MLRLKTLVAAVSLVLLASCTPSEPEGAASATSLRTASTALVTETITVKWSGARPTDTCLNCRTDGTAPGDFECATNSGTGFVYTLSQPLPNPVPGAVVVGMSATVYGRLVSTSDTDDAEQLIVRLNDLDIGTSNEVAEAACIASGACSTGWSRNYTSNPSTTAIPGFGASNTLKVGFSGPDSPGGSRISKYCLSHVDVSFTYLPRTLAVESPAAGSLSFGNQKNGTTSAPLLVTVRNTGQAPVKVITASIHDEAGGTFTLTSPYATPTFELAAGATSQPFSVTFTPSAAGGSASGILSFTSDEEGFPAGNPTLNVNLSGTGVASAVDVAPASLTFDPLRVGSTSTAKTVTVRNVGDVPASASFNITGVSIGPGQPFDVSPKTGFSPVVAGGSGTTLSVTFKPTAEGVDQPGTLTITTDDPDRPTIPVTLKGTGLKSTASLSKTSLTFAPLRVGNTSAGQSLTVSNPGSARLNVSAVSISGPFEVSSTAAFTVDPGGTPVPFTVTFKPTAEGVDQPGLLTFTTDDPDNPTATVTLSGTGIKPTIALSPDPLTFEPQRVDTFSSAKTVTVSNDGSETLNVSSVAVSGPFEVSSTAGFSVTAKGTPKTLTVRFKPTAEGVDQPGLLTFTTNEPGRTTATLALSGTGIKPTIVLNPTSLSFGEQRVDTVSTSKTVTVSNNGSEALNVSSVVVSGPFEVSSTEAFSVAPRGTPKTLTVTFKPTAEGADQPGLVTLTTNEPGKATVTVGLLGTGVQPRLVVTPTTTAAAPLGFGEQRVGTVSSAQTVTVSNATGSGPIRITSVSMGAGEPFVVSPTDAFTLEKGQSKPLSVTFRPTSESAASGTLILTTDYASMPSASVYLSGKGVRPTVEVSTRSLAFGSQPVATSSTARPVTVRNIGSGTLRITSISVSSPSYVLDSTAPFDLTESNREKTLSVTFRPAAQGSIPGTITLNTNDPDNAAVAITLSGNGETALEVTPSTIDFNSVRVGAVGERQVTFTNNGPVPITLQDVSFVSDSQFTLEGLESPVELKPGFPSIPLKVKFSPTRAGTVNAIMTVRSSANNSPHTLSLSGRGTEAKVQISLPAYPGQTALDFGNVEVDSTKQEFVRLTNTGGASLDVTSAKIVTRLADGGTVISTSPFEYRGPSTLRDIAPDGGFVEFPVAFTPPANAGYSATLVINSNAVNHTEELPLIGNGAAARLALSRLSVSFGTQRLGSPSTPQQLFITNEGKATLRIEGFSFTDSDFAVSSPTPLPSPSSPILVAEGARVAIDLRFTPTKRGAVSGTLKVLSNDRESSATLTLDGTGLDGALTVLEPNDGDITFGGVEVGSSSPKAPVRIRNSGDYRLVLRSATIQDPSEDNPFIITGFNSGLPLNPGDVHEFFVTFRPTVNGYQSALLGIQSDSWLNPIENLAVSGTGEGAEVELLRSTINFGKSNVGQSVPQTLSIRNSGVRTLVIHDISFEPKAGLDGGVTGVDDMSLDFNAGRTADGGTVFSLSLDAGSSVPIEMRFSPTAVGLREARGVITSNAKTVKFDVTGQGTSPILKVEPSSLTIGGVLVDNTSAAQQIKITNEGDGPVSLSRITLNQTGTAFTLTHSSVPIHLDPRASETLLVTFRPTEAQPSAVAQLLVEPSLSSVPRILVSITGFGVTQPISVESELDFGLQLIDNTSAPHTLHISNNTGDVINLTGVTVVGADCAQFKPEPLPATSVEVIRDKPVPLNVTFRPRDQSDVNCVLRLSFAQAKPIDVALHGKGIPTVLSVNPSPLDFGGVRIGTAAREEPITLMNLSSDPITLGPPEVSYTNGEPFLFNWGSLEGVVLLPGVPVIKKVRYQPAVESLSETTLYFGTSTPPKPRAVEFKLKAKATRRIVNTDVTSLDFGRVEVSAQAQTKTVTVTNKSAQPQLLSVKLKATETSPFAVDASSLANAIPPEGSATFTVSFDPTEAGEAANDVQVWVQGASEPEVQIGVTGIGRILTGSGSGCACGSTEAGSAGMLMLLALVGLGSRRRRSE